MRQRHSCEQWADWIAEQAASGQSTAGFCAERQLGVQSFYLWKRKLAASAASHVNVGLEKQTSTLISVSLTGLSQVTIELPCGAVIRMPPEDAATRRVIDALLQAGNTR